MHELGLCEPLLEAVREQAAGRVVTSVRVRVGALHAVTPDAFDQAFAVAAQGTEAEGADVDLVVTPALIICRACRTTTESAAPHPLCPVCGAADTEVSGGNELVLESIGLSGEVTDVPRDTG